jgi:hypothetical protein
MIRERFTADGAVHEIASGLSQKADDVAIEVVSDTRRRELEIQSRNDRAWSTNGLAYRRVFRR